MIVICVFVEKFTDVSFYVDYNIYYSFYPPSTLFLSLVYSVTKLPLGQSPGVSPVRGAGAASVSRPHRLQGASGNAPATILFYLVLF